MRTTEPALDWRAELADIIGPDHYGRDFVEAVALDVAGDTPEALKVAGQTLDMVGRACHWLWARLDLEERKHRDLKPYRNLTLPDRRKVDTAPVDLARLPRIRDAMARHNRLLPDLESVAVAALIAESKITERPTRNEG